MYPQDTIPEEWRPVVDWEGLYSVSDQGRVRRDHTVSGTHAGRILTPRTGATRGSAYPHVTLSRDGQHTYPRVHILVARAFLGACPPSHHVNHRNGVKTDNRLLNLEYCTPRENQQHAIATGLAATGDRHWTRVHPELRLWGDRNPSRTQPERVARGAQHTMARLTEALVIEARLLHATGHWTYQALGERYSVHRETVRYAVVRQTWRHVP